jgi:four helix bundle protein
MTIAEGAGQQDRLEFMKRLQNALGFASELEYLLLLARDLNLIAVEPYGRLQNNVVEVKKMLSGLTKTIASHAILRTES